MLRIFQTKKQQELERSLRELNKHTNDVKLYYHEKVRKQKLLTAYYKKELDKKISFTPTLEEIEFFNTEVSRLKTENEKLTEHNLTLKEENKTLKSTLKYHKSK